MLINENLLWSIMASYNTYYDELNFQGEDRDNSALTDSFYDSETEYRYQLKSGFDWTLGKNQVVSFWLG